MSENLTSARQLKGRTIKHVYTVRHNGMLYLRLAFGNGSYIDMPQDSVFDRNGTRVDCSGVPDAEAR